MKYMRGTSKGDKVIYTFIVVGMVIVIIMLGFGVGT
jgi:cell division protein FtsL